MQPDLISETYAVKILCSSGDTIMSTLKGYHSMQECEANSVNTTVAITVPEGQCMSHEGSSSGLVIQCTGWGKIPPTPSPPVPGPNDVAFGARLKYPDRRCVQGTGQVVSGGIVPCDKCVAYAGQDYRKINCATGELALFSTPDCTGTPKSKNPREACAGLGSIRGIYNFEKIYKPLNSVAFFSAYLGSKGCFAENVAATGGVEAGVCTEIKTSNGAQNTFSAFVKVNCNTHTVNIYASSACDSQASFSNSFTDNTCISLPGNQGFISVSCSGYQTPLSNTIKTASPTTPTTKPPSKAPTSGATSNIQMSQIVQAFVLILVAMVVH